MKITNFHAIEEALKNQKGYKLFLSTQNSRTLKLEATANKYNIKVEWISDLEMKKMNSTHTKFLLDLNQKNSLKSKKNKTMTLKEYLNYWSNRNNVLILVLDELTDINNVGAIMRSCDKFSVDLVITPQYNTAPIKESVLRTSSGASEYVPHLTAKNLRQTLEELKNNNFWVYTADLEGEPIDTFDASERNIALIMGNEHKGPRALTQKVSDGSLTITCSGHVDSLNVSVATGIFLYEIRKQQKFFQL